jgi:hypothetical protein
MLMFTGTAAEGLTSLDREELSEGFFTNQLLVCCLVEEEL